MNRTESQSSCHSQNPTVGPDCQPVCSSVCSRKATCHSAARLPTLAFHGGLSQSQVTNVCLQSDCGSEPVYSNSHTGSCSCITVSLQRPRPSAEGKSWNVIFLSHGVIFFHFLLQLVLSGPLDRAAPRSVAASSRTLWSVTVAMAPAYVNLGTVATPARKVSSLNVSLVKHDDGEKKWERKWENT